MSNLALYRSDATGVTYADPLNPDYSVRFKFTEAGKSLSGIPVKNHVTEIIINDLASVTIGAETVNEAIAVRIKTSGSSAAATRIAEIMTAVSAQLNTWQTENVSQGFAPSTAPTAPVSV